MYEFVLFTYDAGKIEYGLITIEFDREQLHHTYEEIDVFLSKTYFYF